MESCHNRHGHHPLVKLAIEAIETYIKERRVIEPPEEATPEMADKAGVFVCLKKDGELRGCIGTFLPTAENVAAEIIKNSISAATEDPRFNCVDSRRTRMPRLLRGRAVRPGAGKEPL